MKKMIPVALCVALVSCASYEKHIPQSTGCDFYMASEPPFLDEHSLPEPVEISEGSGVLTFPGTFSEEFEQDLILLLATELPCAYDVLIVPTTLPPGLYGLTYYDEEQEHLTVLLSAHQSVPQLVDTLVHEWAHALTWDVPGSNHSASWGVMYAEGYRLLIDD